MLISVGRSPRLIRTLATARSLALETLPVGSLSEKLVTLCHLAGFQIAGDNQHVYRFVQLRSSPNQATALLKAERNFSKVAMWAAAQLRFTIVPFCGRSVT